MERSILSKEEAVHGVGRREANNESSEVFDIIKPGQRVKIKGHRQ